MLLSRLIAAAALGGAVLAASGASAHVTLADQQAAVGAGYKAVLRVPHGCEGTATFKLSVEIPPGVVSVKPMVKPGWQVEVTRGAYDRPTVLHGTPLTHGVKLITWSGGKLPDEFYDEFAFNSFLDKRLEPGTKLYFPVVQTCEKGSESWTEIPAAGKTAADLDAPAPGLTLLPARE